MQIVRNPKSEAIKLRLQGKSIRDIEKILGVRRSTLSGWLRSVQLSQEQKDALHTGWLDSLSRARVKAGATHRNRRLDRIAAIKEDVRYFLKHATLDKVVGHLLFAVFYLAEGTKKESSVVIANSNPKILKSLLALFRYLYEPDETKLHCCLHLRKDQQEEECKNYWSNLLGIPQSQFMKTQFDQRAIKPTTNGYKGVCVIYYYSMDLQRRILYVGDGLLDKIDSLKGS